MNKLLYGLLLTIFQVWIQIYANDEISLPQISKRDVGCPASPPGQPECCVPDKDALPTYEHTDEQGNTCTCDYCRSPMYVIKPCVCTPGDPIGDVECGFPVKGKTYMPNYPLNKCNNPFNCTTICEGNLTITEPCTITGDAVCDCNEDQGLYRSGDSTCSVIPLCDAKLERYHPIGSQYPSFRCVPCGIDEDCGHATPTTMATTVLTKLIVSLITLRNYTGTTPSAISTTYPGTYPSRTQVQGIDVSTLLIIMIITICLFSVMLVLVFILVVWICRGQGRVCEQYDTVPQFFSNEEHQETPV